MILKYRAQALGLNVFHPNAVNYQPNAWAILKDLGVNTIRVGSGVEGDLHHINISKYPTEWAQSLDAFLSEAASHGIKVFFIQMGTQWDTLLGIVSPAPEQGIVGTPIATAKTMIDQLAGNNALNHNFITDMRIFGWSVSNEVNIGDPTTYDWNIQIADYIRSKGGKAWLSCPNDQTAGNWWESISFQRTEPLLRGHVDMLEIHYYGDRVAAEGSNAGTDVYSGFARPRPAQDDHTVKTPDCLPGLNQALALLAPPVFVPLVAVLEIRHCNGACLLRQTNRHIDFIQLDGPVHQVARLQRLHLLRQRAAIVLAIPQAKQRGAGKAIEQDMEQALDAALQGFGDPLRKTPISMPTIIAMITAVIISFRLVCQACCSQLPAGICVGNGVGWITRMAGGCVGSGVGVAWAGRGGGWGRGGLRPGGQRQQQQQSEEKNEHPANSFHMQATNLRVRFYRINLFLRVQLQQLELIRRRLQIVVEDFLIDLFHLFLESPHCTLPFRFHLGVRLAALQGALAPLPGARQRGARRLDLSVDLLAHLDPRQREAAAFQHVVRQAASRGRRTDCRPGLAACLYRAGRRTCHLPSPCGCGRRSRACFST